MSAASPQPRSFAPAPIVVVGQPSVHQPHSAAMITLWVVLGLIGLGFAVWLVVNANRLFPQDSKTVVLGTGASIIVPNQVVDQLIANKGNISRAGGQPKQFTGSADAQCIAPNSWEADNRAHKVAPIHYQYFYTNTTGAPQLVNIATCFQGMDAKFQLNERVVFDGSVSHEYHDGNALYTFGVTLAPGLNMVDFSMRPKLGSNENTWFIADCVDKETRKCLFVTGQDWAVTQYDALAPVPKSK